MPIKSQTSDWHITFIKTYSVEWDMLIILVLIGRMQFLAWTKFIDGSSHKSQKLGASNQKNQKLF